jgi:hypothetical protein
MPKNLKTPNTNIEYYSLTQHLKDKRNEHILYGHIFTTHIHYNELTKNGDGESEDVNDINKPIQGHSGESAIFCEYINQEI